MGWPRQTRRICKRQGCGIRCKMPAHIYCSTACAREGRRARPLPLCPICEERPRHRHKKTCGRACGVIQAALSKRLAGTQNLERFQQGARKGFQLAFRRRFIAYLKSMVAQVEAAQSSADRAKVLAQVYTRGKGDGKALSYYRYVKVPQQRERAS